MGDEAVANMWESSPAWSKSIIYNFGQHLQDYRQERISENFLGNLDRFFRGGPFSGLQRDIRRNKGTKIALLCTGIEHESIITWHGRDPIVKSRSWVGNKDECGDFDGFGTLATHALLTACHRPRIYIAKVTRTAEFEPNICDIIAEV